MSNIIINNKPYTKDCKGFYIMPNELHFLLDDLGLSAQEKLMYECLVRYGNNSEIIHSQVIAPFKDLFHVEEILLLKG